MKYLQWIILVALIIWGVVAYTNRSTEPAESTEPTAAQPLNTDQAANISQTADTAADSTTDTTVVYNGRAFVPETLTLTAGQTVTFVNDSDSLLWVASDPHPIHTSIPGFDSLAGISLNNTYSFTFNEAGTFGYHNHLNTAQTGVITVQ